MRHSAVLLLLLIASAPVLAQPEPGGGGPAGPATVANTGAPAEIRAAAPSGRQGATREQASRTDSLAAAESIAASWRRQVAPALGTGVLVLFASVSLAFIIAAAQRLGRGEEFEVTSHWGGFGGGLGGWRISPPLVLLATGLAIAAMLSLVAASMLGSGGNAPAAPPAAAAAR
jgi:hypothetical protein